MGLVAEGEVRPLVGVVLKAAGVRELAEHHAACR